MEDYMTNQQQGIDTEQKKEKVILVAVSDKGDTQRVIESLCELEELAKTAGAITVEHIIQNRDSVHPGTYVGKGKMEEIKNAIYAHGADGIITDDELTPAQIKNLEKELNTNIMDRSLLILDIFAQHAHTREGILQVELAQLTYRSSRLAGLGRSLTRQGGGIGTRGPGEKKLETDRRHIRRRVGLLREELAEVSKHRNLLRTNRKKLSVPVVAIAGYTNAGKSTLLNVLTSSDVLEEDKLFATLDPTTRQLRLPEGKEVYLTDTVGFINKLPHHLVEAFKSTLEEVIYADLIIHVIDASSPYIEKHMKVFYDTLAKLKATDIPVVTVFNKMDLAQVPTSELRDDQAMKTCYISARTGENLQELVNILDEHLKDGLSLIKVRIPYEKANIINNIRKFGQLLVEEFEADGIYVEAYLEESLIKKYDL